MKFYMIFEAKLQELVNMNICYMVLEMITHRFRGQQIINVKKLLF